MKMLRVNLKRVAAALCAVVAMALTVQAQLTAQHAFAMAPREVFPMLSNLTRLDMIDYYASGARTSSTNLLGGRSRIEHASPVQLRVKMSDVSTYTITILPSGRDSVIALTAEILTPVPDGYLTLYDSSWKPLATKRFKVPGLKDWVLPSGRKVMDDIENQVPFVPVTYTLDPETLILTLTQNVGDLIPAEEYAKVKDYLRAELRYRWTGSKMTLIKD